MSYKQVNNIKAVSDEIAYHCGYQQALSDFGINDLKAKLSYYFKTNCSNKERYLEEQDQESLISILVQHLSNNLKSKLIDNYLKALEVGSYEVSLSEIPLSKEPPINFKYSAKPCYKDGEILRWNPAKGGVDWGISLGRFYTYAPHLRRWGWKYIILLDSHSPSAAWVVADTAWQEDLQLFEEEVAR